MKQIRPYQADASSAIVSAWNKHRSCIATVATGGGKTLIMADTTQKVKDKGRVLVLANRNELCLQPMSVFQNQLGLVPALEKAEFKASLSAPVVIASVQTLSRQNRLARFPEDHFSFVFADECHMSLAESWKRIFSHFPKAKLCGVTATPFRSDNKSLSDVYEIEAYRKELLALVDEGWLVDPDHVDRLSTAISLADVRVKKTTEGIDYDLNDAADAIAPWLDEIAKEIKAKYDKRHILSFLPLIASSQKFVEACVRNGINAVHVDGEDPQREQKLQAFKAGQITLLSNSNLLHTGVDLPSCDCTLNLRPTRSKVLYCQIVGRSTRTVPGLIDNLNSKEERLSAIADSAKPEAFILDPLWLSDDLNLVTPSFLVAPDEQYAQEMQKRAGKSYSLRDMRRIIQLEREEAIARHLQNVASFRSGRVSAAFFAASTHQLDLLTYQPVYHWETAPTRNFAKLCLETRGIDPESVTCEGHAWALIKAVNRRRHQRLAEIRDLAPLTDRWPVEELLSFSAEKAKRMGVNVTVYNDYQ